MKFSLKEIVPEIVNFTRGGLYKPGTQAQKAMEEQKRLAEQKPNTDIFRQAADVATKISEAPSRLLGTALSLKKGTPLLQTPAPFIGEKIEEGTRWVIKETPIEQIPFARTALPFVAGQIAEFATPGIGGEAKLTTKFLDYAKGKTTLSRQEIMDFARRPELKKGEADLLTKYGQQVKGKIPAQEFADSIRRDLLELKPVKVKEPQYESTSIQQRQVDARTSVEDFESGIIKTPKSKNYEEVVFESPITTNGSSHYPNSKNYFAHARGDEVVEGGKKIWREQEIQSDLLQKEGLERAKPDIVERVKVGNREFEVVRNRFGADEATPKKFSEFQMDDPVSKTDLASGNGVGVTALDGNKMTREEAMRAAKEAQKVLDTKSAELEKLSPFTNDRFGERIMRERIKEKAQKGYEKYRLPTGETIGKIEGFENPSWMIETGSNRGKYLTKENLKVGDEVMSGDVIQNNNQWIITDILGEGRFKAVPKEFVDNAIRDAKTLPGAQYIKDMNWDEATKLLKENGLDAYAKTLETWYRNATETFDLTGKSNPQYRRYSDWGKFLKNKYGGKETIDPQGNSWVEIDLKKEYARMPIEAFSVLPLALTEAESSQEQN